MIIHISKNDINNNDDNNKDKKCMHRVSAGLGWAIPECEWGQSNTADEGLCIPYQP